MGISVAAAGQTQRVKAAVDTQTADTGVAATTDTANQTTETTTIGKNQISIKDFASHKPLTNATVTSSVILLFFLNQSFESLM